MESAINSGFLRTAATRTRVAMWSCLALIAISAWAYLLAVSPTTDTGILLIELLKSLCRPDAAPWALSTLAAALVMWIAMGLAMMLPSAGPMISTYIDIATAAREKGMTVAAPTVLAGGYATVWIGFAFAATTLQAGLRTQGFMSGDDVLNTPALSATVLVFAGCYQFSSFKYACLAKCRNPMPFFLTHWRDDARGVFTIGVSQGLFCLGCCWALMIVMFVTGLMNLSWMAVFSAVMILEKTLPNPRPVVYGAGVSLIAAGLLMALS